MLRKNQDSTWDFEFENDRNWKNYDGCGEPFAKEVEDTIADNIRKILEYSNELNQADFIVKRNLKVEIRCNPDPQFKDEMVKMKQKIQAAEEDLKKFKNEIKKQEKTKAQCEKDLDDLESETYCSINETDEKILEKIATDIDSLLKGQIKNQMDETIPSEKEKQSEIKFQLKILYEKLEKVKKLNHIPENVNIWKCLLKLIECNVKIAKYINNIKSLNNEIIYLKRKLRNNKGKYYFSYERLGRMIEIMKMIKQGSCNAFSGKNNEEGGKSAENQENKCNSENIENGNNSSEIVLEYKTKIEKSFLILFNRITEIVHNIEDLKKKGGELNAFNYNNIKKMPPIKIDKDNLLEKFAAETKTELDAYESNVNQKGGLVFHELYKDEAEKLYKYIKSNNENIEDLKLNQLMKLIYPNSEINQLKEYWKNQKPDLFDFYQDIVDKRIFNQSRIITKSQSIIDPQLKMTEMRKEKLYVTCDCNNSQIVQVLCSYFINFKELPLLQNILLVEEHTLSYTIEHFFKKAEKMVEIFYIILTSDWSNETAHDDKKELIFRHSIKCITKDFKGKLVLIVPKLNFKQFNDKEYLCGMCCEFKTKDIIFDKKTIREFITDQSRFQGDFQVNCYKSERAGDGKSFDIKKLAKKLGLTYKELTLGSKINFSNQVNRVYKHLADAKDKEILFNFAIGHPPSWRSNDKSVFNAHVSVFIFLLITLGGYRAEEGCILIDESKIKSIQLEKKNVFKMEDPEILNFLPTRQVASFLTNDGKLIFEKIDVSCDEDLNSKIFFDNEKKYTFFSILWCFFSLCELKDNCRKINMQMVSFPPPLAGNYMKSFKENKEIEMQQKKTELLKYLEEYIWNKMKDESTKINFKNLNIKKFLDICILMVHEIQDFNDPSLLGENFFKKNYFRLKEYRFKVIEELIKVTLMYCYSSVTNYEAVQEFALDVADSDHQQENNRAYVRMGELKKSYINFENLKLVIMCFTKQNNFRLLYSKNVENDVPSHIKEFSINQQMFVDFNRKYEIPSEIKNYLNAKEGIIPNDILKYTERIKSLDDCTSSELWVILQDIFALTDDELIKAKENFILTKNNFLKIVMICRKIRARLPVVIAGDTGTGKTHISYFISNMILPKLSIPGREYIENSKVIFKHLMIHADQAENDIAQIVEEFVHEATGSKNNIFVLFLDEFNTTPAIDLVNELLADHQMFGKDLPPNFFVLGACNSFVQDVPDENLVNAIINREQNALVKPKVVNKTVYSVFPISEIILGYLLDFGSLQKEEEEQLAEFLFWNSLLKIIVKESLLKITEKQSLQKLLENESLLKPCQQDNLKELLKNESLQQILESESLHKIVESESAQSVLNINIKKYKPLFKLVADSQRYMRRIFNKRYVTSVRDMKRFNEIFIFFVTVYFPKKREYLLKKNQKQIEEINIKIDEELKELGNIETIIKKSYILALNIGYCLRLHSYKDRKEFVEQMVFILEKENLLNVGKDEFFNCFDKEANFIFNNLDTNAFFPAIIANNKTLRENLLSIFVCLMANVPILLCGKPGCSKTLSKNLLIKNCKGKNSNSVFFSLFPCLVFEYFQGSESSTSESVAKAFENARSKYYIAKEMNVNEDYIPVLIIDEFELTEISRNNLSKVMNLYLDNPGQPGRKNGEPSTGFLGISNWTLDAAKNNRFVIIAGENCQVEN